MVEDKTVSNKRDDQDSGYSEEEALIIFPKKRTKAETCYRRANAAIIPDYIPPEERKPTDCELMETRVFTPDNGLSEQQLWNFVCLAAKFGFNMEQSFAILHSNEYDIEESHGDLTRFAPLPSQWRHNKSAFINALKEEEKYFYAIKDRFFPNLKVTNMVEYYYTWKMEEKKRKLREEWRKTQKLLKMKMKLKKTCSQNDIAPPV